MRRVWGLIALLLYTYCLAAAANTVPPRALTRETKYYVRAVWLTTVHGLDWPKCKADTPRGVAQQKKDLDNLLDKLRLAGINTVYLQVRGRGDLLYPSQIEPISPTMAFPGKQPLYDPLRYAVNACHSRGMRIIAWLVTLPLGNKKYIERLGNKAYAYTHKKKCVFFRGEWYMDPAAMETSTHLSEICKEIVCNYSVDGIHLDYIRYPDKAERFPDNKVYTQSKTSSSLPEWRKNNINTLVETVSQQVKQINSTLEVSAAPLGKYRKLPAYPTVGWTALESVNQDPIIWGTKKWVDAIVPMMYYKDNLFYPFLQDWLTLTPMPIIVGLGAYQLLPNEGNWNASDLIKQVDYLSKEPKVQGVCYFRAEQVVNPNIGLYSYLVEQNKKLPALPLAPKDTLKLIQPEYLEVNRVGDSLEISWVAKPTFPCSYTIYHAVGNDLNLQKDLYAITQHTRIKIPLDKLDKNELHYFAVGVYRLRDGSEGITPTAVYYYRDSI